MKLKTKFAKNIIRHLKLKGMTNPDAIAIMLAESHFRPIDVILVEYIIYSILKFIGLDRYKTITLGRGQIRAVNLTNINLKSVMSFSSAYQEIVSNWQKKNLIHKSIEIKIAIHVGEVRSHYLKLVKSYKKIIKDCTP